jgi:hypothetical protein
MDTLTEQPAGSGCEIGPTGQGLRRCHTHGPRASARIWASYATTGRLVTVNP